MQITIFNALIFNLSHLVHVKIENSTQQLLHDHLNVAVAKFNVRIRQQTSQIMFTELKNQEECRSEIVLHRRSCVHNFYQIYDILMF